MSRIIIGIAGIGFSVISYNIGYNAGLSEMSSSDAYRLLIDQVSKEKKLSDPVPREYLENWAKGYYE